MRRFLPLLAASLALTVGCQAPTPIAPKPKPRASTADPRPTGPGAGTEALRRIADDAVARSLTGKVKLISDHGGAIISNNSGGAISENGAGAISENGAGVIANNGAGLTSKTKYALARAASEALLAEAVVEVLDGAGRVLADAAGKPIAATTDRQGAFKLAAKLPAEGLVLRVRVAKAGLLPGGELRAIVPRDAAADATADVDTAASLGASYVLARFVKGEQAVLDKLPTREAEALHAALGGALGKLGATTGLAPDEQVAAAERLRGEDAGVRGSLEKIEAILVAGVQNLGVGLPATSVALLTPSALVVEPDGGLLVAERVPGRVRHVRRDGTMDMLIDAEQGAWKFNFGSLKALRRGPDGALYSVETEPRRIQRVDAAGQATVLAGNGATGPAAALSVSSLAIRPDGALVLALANAVGERLAILAADGTVTPVPTPAEFGPGYGVGDVAVASDGAIWALFAADTALPVTLARRAPDGAWKVMAADLRCGEYGGIVADRDGAVLVAEDLGNRVLRLDAAGAREVVAGDGGTGPAPDGADARTAGLGRPAGLARAADGTLYLVERASSLVRAIGPDGELRTIAGASGVVRVGDALAVSMSAPGGMALDPQGRLVIAETGASLIRAFDGERLTTIAGGVEGDAGDGGPLKDARFDEPTGVTYAPDGALWIADTHYVRRAGPDGIVRKLAGNGPGSGVLQNATHEPLPGSAVRFHDLAGIAVGPDGAAYVASNRGHQIVRVAPDGTTRVVAGLAPPGGIPQGGDGGDGGPARAAQLQMPLGLAFRPGANPPELFVADGANLRIRKVIDPGGPEPRIEAVAGLPSQVESFVKVLADPDAVLKGPTPANEAVFLVPFGLAFDAAGDLYVSEAGTASLVARGGQFVQLDLSGLPKIGSRVRRIALSQAGAPVTTIAGPGGRVLAGKGDAGLYFAAAIAFDRTGRLVVADPGANQLKLIPVEALK